MEKDPQVVADLARRREDENWRFRAFLKRASHRVVQQVNASARHAGEAARDQMDCTTCAACCRDNWVPLTEDEIARLSRRLQIDPETFRARYLTKDDEEDGWAIDARPCPFLVGTRCSVYEDRPEVCREYPYIGGDLPTRMLGVIERAATCPIIFEMLEHVKRDIGFDRFSRRRR